MNQHVVGAGDGQPERPAARATAALSLTMLQAEDQQRKLGEVVSRGRSWVEAMRREHPPEPPDEMTIELLDAITSEPGAKDSWRLLGDQVRAGLTSWTTVWLSREYGRTRLELKLEVTSRIARSLDFSQVPGPETRRPPEEPQGGVLR